VNGSSIYDEPVVLMGIDRTYRTFLAT
jgi:hypothetical protein